MRMRIAAVAVIVVLGVGVLQMFRGHFAWEPVAFALDEQAGSLLVESPAEDDDLLTPIQPKNRGAGAIVIDGDARRNDDPLERQARQVYQQLKQRIAAGKQPSQRDADLKVALDRYFANSKLDQAIQLLETVVKEADGTPEASRAASAIQVLKRTPGDPLIEPAGKKDSARRTPAHETLGDYPTLVKPASGVSVRKR